MTDFVWSCGHYRHWALRCVRAAPSTTHPAITFDVNAEKHRQVTNTH